MMEKVGFKGRDQRDFLPDRWAFLNFEWQRVKRNWTREEEERTGGKTDEYVLVWKAQSKHKEKE